MGLENTSNIPDSVVARIFRGDACCGTGFLVLPDLVLTCFHVTDRDTDKALMLRFAGDDFQPVRVEAISEAHDLALIRIPRREARAPISFLTGLKTHHENALRKLNWQAIGYDLRDSETFLSATSAGREPAFQWDNKTGTLLDVQIDLGLPNGFSGGPVLIEIQGKTLCIGILTQGGEDRPKSRIRLADCIVGFLEEYGLKVESQDAFEVLGPAKFSAALARPPENGTSMERRTRSRRWIAAIGPLVATAVAGLYLYLKQAPNVEAPEPKFVEADQKRLSSALVPSFYEVKIMMYTSATPPRLYINKKRAALDRYDGRTATLRLHPGSYQVEADYIDRICTAIVSVAGDLTTEAECHLR